jgi:chromate transporter
MMQDEVVERRRWLTQDQFLDLLGATNFIPGPNSTEMAIHIGWGRRRWAGLLVAGLSFIVPAMLITGGLGWAYVRFGKLPETAWLLWGIKPVILAIVAQALWRLAPTAAASFLGAHELLILLGSGAVVAAARARRDPGRATLSQLMPILPAAAGVGAISVLSLPGLFWVFLKIGSVLFGSGYVLLAFLRADLVQRLHWLTEAQLIDAIAAGQVTPGPVFTTATFIGYILAGPAGAMVATAGIFLPAFVFVALSGPLVPRLRASRTAGAFLDGVNVASLALIVVVAAQLARAAVVDVTTALIGLTATFVLLRFKLNSTWLVLGGAAAGIGAHVLGMAR